MSSEALRGILRRSATGSTGSPKIAYATGFHLPDRDQVFVVASGIYPLIGIYPDK